jgi:hypothetical protein
MTKHLVRHKKANLEAKTLVRKHDGDANRIIEEKVGKEILQGDLNSALHFDQVRREIKNLE